MKNKTLVIAWFLAVVIIVSVSFILENLKEKEPQEETTTIDKEELAWIFEIGYLKGRVNEMKCETFEESRIKWQKDSAEIVGIYFKKETK